MRLCTWFAGLDLDSRYLTATLGFSSDNATPRVLGSKVVEIPHLEQSRSDLRLLLGQALPDLGEWFHLESGGALSGVALTVPGSAIQETPSSGTCDFGQPTRIDAAAISQARQRAATLPNKLGRVLSSTVCAYELDGRRHTKAPLGEVGSTLRVELTSWLARPEHVGPVIEAVEAQGFDVELIAPRAIATAEATLTPLERQQGAVVVQIGDEVTECATFIDGDFSDVWTISLGRAPLISELARACHVTNEVIDRLDLALMIERMPSDPMVQRVRTVISAWGSALFTSVRRRLDDRNLTWRVQSGVVIANSSHSFPSLEERAMKVVGVPARFAVESRSFQRVSGVSRGSFAALGLIPLQWSAHPEEPELEKFEPVEPTRSSVIDSRGNVTRGGFGQALGRWLREFVPAGDS